jgi:putative hydrolase
VNIRIDTHTHSVASGHAYSTVLEIAREARNNRLEGFVLTDHGSSLKGAPYYYHFGNMKVIPPVLDGVRFFSGAEANIVSFDGVLDLPERFYRGLDFMLAGLHEICLEPGTQEENTRALLRAMENPYVDAVSHPENPVFPIDIEAFVDAAAEHRKPVELNDSSFRVRKGSAERCEAIAIACRDRGVRVVCGSDAHIAFDVGRFDNVLPLLERIGMPERLVVNASLESFSAYLEERRERICAAERDLSAR